MRQGAVYGALINVIPQTADAEAAYTQHILTEADGPPVYVRMPRSWLKPEHQHLRDPVFLLLRPLYGHPCAGRIWESHLCNEISQIEIKTFDPATKSTVISKWIPVPEHPNSWT